MSRSAPSGGSGGGLTGVGSLSFSRAVLTAVDADKQLAGDGSHCRGSSKHDRPFKKVTPRDEVAPHPARLLRTTGPTFAACQSTCSRSCSPASRPTIVGTNEAIVTSDCAPTPMRAYHRHDGEQRCACKRRRSSSSPAIAQMIKTPDNNDGEQDGFVGQAEGLLAEVDQRSGQQINDQFADGGTGNRPARRSMPCQARRFRGRPGQRRLQRALPTIGWRVPRPARRVCAPPHPAPLRLFEQRTGAYVSITLFGAARASRAWIRLLRRRSQRKSASAPSSSARRARDYRRSQLYVANMPPGCVDYYPSWIADADRLFKVLQDEIVWERHAITLYDRTMPTPRLTAWISDNRHTATPEL